MPPFSVVPDTVRLIVTPTEILEPTVIIENVPASGPVTARVEGGAPGIALVGITVYRRFRRAFTEEEILELPPFPTSIRENARRLGEMVLEQTGHSDGATPVPVVSGQQIIVGLRFIGSAPGVAEVSSATLVIEGSSWGPVTVPLSMLVADLTVELLAAGVEVRQGAEASLPVRVVSLAGPATEVRLALTDNNQWSVPLHVQPVARGESATFAVRVLARPDAPLGTWRTTLSVNAFNGLYVRMLSFDITIRQGRLSVIGLASGPLVGIRGRRITVPVRTIAAGYGAEVVFQPAAVPAGVVIPTQTRTARMGTTTDHVLDIDVQIDAPLHTSVPFSINWSAGPEFSGSLPFLITVLPPEVTFHQVITTPTGTALGGWVEVTVRSNGTYVFRGHMHGSGFDPYEFRVVAFIRSGSGRGMVAAQKSGSVGGTIGGGSRDFDWVEEGVSPRIATDWADVSRGSMAVNKEYDDTGVLGVLSDIAAAAVDWLVAVVLTNPLTASIYVLGRELGNLTGVQFAPPNIAAGIAVKEGIVLIFGPLGTFVGMVAGGIAAASIEQRDMEQDERDFADRVFHGTIDFDRVVLTDISRGGRKFAIPHVDGRVLIGLGDFFDSPMTRFDETYTTPGQVFIHELVHAWQITHTAFLTEVFLDAAANTACEIIGQKPYQLTTPLPAWGELNQEQQASVVDQWYQAHKQAIDASSPTSLTDGPALDDEAFPYIIGNIWTGAT
jgi:hypothetical protein